MATLGEYYISLINYMEEAFSERRRLSDVIDVGSNPEIILKSGYGLRVGSGSSSPQDMPNVTSIRQGFTAIFTNIVYGINTDYSEIDNAIMRLFDDQMTLIAKLKSNSNLGTFGEFANTNGIVEVPIDRGSFLMCEISFDLNFYNAC